jgi:hypothetical protein
MRVLDGREAAQRYAAEQNIIEIQGILRLNDKLADEFEDDLGEISESTDCEEKYLFSLKALHGLRNCAKKSIQSFAVGTLDQDLFADSKIPSSGRLHLLECQEIKKGMHLISSVVQTISDKPGDILRAATTRLMDDVYTHYNKESKGVDSSITEMLAMVCALMDRKNVAVVEWQRAYTTVSKKMEYLIAHADDGEIVTMLKPALFIPIEKAD